MCLGNTGTRRVVRGASHALKSCCVWQYLEWREKQYDLRVRVDVFGRESAEEPIVSGALTYIASDDRVKNLNYAGASCQTCSGSRLHSVPSVLHDTFATAPATKVLCITSEECWAYAHCGRSRPHIDRLALRSSTLSYAGPAPREAIALQIASAFGPSGPNAEYLHGLVAALKQVCATSALERRAAVCLARNT